MDDHTALTDCDILLHLAEALAIRMTKLQQEMTDGILDGPPLLFSLPRLLLVNKPMHSSGGQRSHKVLAKLARQLWRHSERRSSAHVKLLIHSALRGYTG